MGPKGLFTQVSNWRVVSVRGRAHCRHGRCAYVRTSYVISPAAAFGHSPFVAEAADGAPIFKPSVYYLSVIAVDRRVGGNDQVGTLG